MDVELMSRLLQSMKDEYKVCPSTFLKKKIELCENKIKQVLKAEPRSTIQSSNYK